MEKKPYVRIDFKNCGLDYDYTICSWADVPDYIQSVDPDFSFFNERVFNSYKDKDCLPEVKLTVIMMTDSEFEKWFIDHVQASA